MTKGQGPARLLATLAMAGILITAAAPAATAADPSAGDDATTVVTGTSMDTGALPTVPATPRAAKPDPRSMAGRRVPTRDHASPEGSVTTAPRTVGREPRSNGPIAAAELTEGFSAFGGIEASANDTYATDATGAILGSSLLTANELYLTQRNASSLEYVREWALPTFFKIPATEYYWGGSVAASLYKGRFVVAMASFESGCTRSWLNVAVSKTSSPTGGWNLFRIAIADAYTDAVSIGLSDDKVVLAVNEWDMNQVDCIGSPYEGSRIRVADWADLIDGGTLTVRDVSSTPRTSYYSWVAASNVPTTSSTAAGPTVRLVGDKYANSTWGHVAYAGVTGSAKAGTAKLVGLSDLSVSRSLELLVGPPETIAAFPSGNGGQDERVLSAVARAGKVWFSANATCLVGVEATQHACARYTLLDTAATPPTVADQAWFLTADTDTFHPLVGTTRGGSSFFTMTRAAATSPTAMETWATYRDAGSPIAGGADEELVTTNAHTWPFQFWARRGSIVADPAQPDTALAVVPAGCYEGIACAELLRLRANVTAAPDGTASLGIYKNGWAYGTRPQANFSPAATSPIKWVRMADSPTTEDTTEGPHLVNGTTWSSMGLNYLELGATATGGGGQGDTVEGWIQWGTGSAWSTPIEVGATLDLTPPEYTQQPLAFALGTVGATVPVRLSWSTTDPESGIVEHLVSWNCSNPDNTISMLPGTARTTTKLLHLNGSCTQYFASPQNGAGGQGYAQFPPKVTFRAIQGTTTALSYGKIWSTQTSNSFLGGSTRYATAAGATFTYTFTGRAVGFVTTKGTNRGKAEVWVDGVKVTTLDLKAASTQYRRLVWQTSWATAGAHTVRIKVLGTPGRPRVDADAFVRF